VRCPPERIEGTFLKLSRLLFRRKMLHCVQHDKAISNYFNPFISIPLFSHHYFKNQFMLKKFLIITILSANMIAHAQTSSSPKWEAKKWRTVEASEFIFSSGDLKVKDAEEDADNKVRFSMFFHFQSQWHYDFNKNIGIYTGVGMRNVGFIHTWKVEDEELKIKHRSYSLGVPLAIKFGNIEKGVYGAMGGEAELMFAYKRKLFFDGDKSKESEWFSDKVNLFNPSVFAEIRFKRGTYIRVKYYMMDFLSNKEDKFVLPGTSIEASLKPESSTLFSISIGTALKSRLKKKTVATKTEV
jgi:hypothetical protein